MPAAGGDDALAGLTRGSFSHGGVTRDVYRAGRGPAVVVIHEVPGITPLVAAFGRRVAAEGLTAVLPSLFGEPGRARSGAYVARTVLQGCVSREFASFALRSTSPVTEWLRALARQAHAECGGPGVGAVGMCFTGGFALGMAVDEEMLAPVLSQPSLPLALTRSRAHDIGVSDSDLQRVRQRTAQGLCVMGLRFTGDRLVPAARFERLREELGDAFIAVEIDSSSGNRHGVPRDAHSVLTEHLVDEPGHPTRDALDGVIAFFRERLLA